MLFVAIEQHFSAIAAPHHFFSLPHVPADFPWERGDRAMQYLTRRELIIATTMGLLLPTATSAHQRKLPDRFEPQLVNTRRKHWMTGDIHVVPDSFFLYFMLDISLTSFNNKLLNEFISNIISGIIDLYKPM